MALGHESENCDSKNLTRCLAPRSESMNLELDCETKSPKIRLWAERAFGAYDRLRFALCGSMNPLNCLETRHEMKNPTRNLELGYELKNQKNLEPRC